MNDKVYIHITPEHECPYLPDRLCRLEYRVISGLTVDDFGLMVRSGWRRFGHALFKPRCSACRACQPIRVLVDQFKPDRSQRRVAKANADTVLRIGAPAVDMERIDLYYRHHAHHAEQKGWPEPEAGSFDHPLNIINGPFPVEEWDYYVGDKLVAVAYIDHLQDGYSGIYFYHDPDFRQRSLGNWICLTMLEQAKVNGLPYVYFGYYINGCRSMEYKGRFEPNEVLAESGDWVKFNGFRD